MCLCECNLLALLQIDLQKSKGKIIQGNTDKSNLEHERDLVHKTSNGCMQGRLTEFVSLAGNFKACILAAIKRKFIDHS